MAVLSIPANLLLFGEYAVLEEGGLGLAVAIERRVMVTSTPAERLSIRGRWGEQRVEWGSPSDDAPLFAAAVAACDRALARRGRRAGTYPVRLEVDSTALFEPGDRKGGFGSSAAVAAGVVAALLRATLIEPTIDEALVFEAALDAHRFFQGGRGSGYDVAASLAGGRLLFIGGSHPSYRRVALPWLRPFSLVHADRPVKTSGAIGRYDEWKRANPKEAKRFLLRSNELVEGLLACESWEEARAIIVEAAAHGIALGRSIDLSAEVSAPKRQPTPRALPEEDRGESTVVKALGAGNEVAAVWRPTGGPPPDGRITIAERGLSWNE